MSDARDTRLSIAYVGVPLAGRTTSLRYVLTATGCPTRTRVLDPTAAHAFDLDAVALTAAIARVRGGARWIDPDAPTPEYLAERAWLGRVDGMIFLLDCQHVRHAANDAFLEGLRSDLDREGRDLDEVPVAFQANKRDIVEPWEVAVLRERMWTKRSAFVETCATQGIGVLAAVRAVIGIVRDS